jgi:hypothetical protein
MGRDRAPVSEDPASVAIRLAWLHLFRRRIRRTWRRILVLAGIRRLTPGDGEPRPSVSVWIEDPDDTGGSFYRPSHRMQDPSIDPREPYGGESSGTGNDHGWSGCTMSSGADVMALATGGEIAPWGGDLRHRQGDLSGGTDLGDLRDAFRAYGEELTIRSGGGWSAVVADHDAGYPIVMQGSGNVPGSATFDGGHACAISPEPKGDGQWLFGDPLASGWQWVEPSAIKTWAQHWQSSIAWARGARMGSAPPEPGPAPAPEPMPCPPPETHTEAELEELARRGGAVALEVAGDALVGAWLAWLRAPRSGPSDRWNVGSWSDPLEVLEATLEDDEPDPCYQPASPAAWARGIPFPVAEALEALTSPAAWDRSGWRESTWQRSDAPGTRSPRSMLPAWP